MKKILVLIATTFAALIFFAQGAFATDNNIQSLQIDQLGDAYMSYSNRGPYWRVVSHEDNHFKGTAYFDANHTVVASNSKFIVQIDGLFEDSPKNLTEVSTDANGNFDALLNVGNGAGFDYEKIYNFIHRYDTIYIKFRNSDGTYFNDIVNRNTDTQIDKIYRLAYRYLDYTN